MARLINQTLAVIGWLMISQAAAQPAPATLLFADDAFAARDAAKEELGRLLFFDKILSGNFDIACSTCHHPLAATGDSLSLPLGTGAAGFGPARRPGGPRGTVAQRVPRNAPPLFNLGADEFGELFLDGRLSADPGRPGVFSNAGEAPLPDGLDSLLAAQAMLSVTSTLEMAGQQGENPVADAVFADRLDGPGGAWDLLAARLRSNAAYADRFVGAFAELQSPEQIRFVHAANALAAFQSAAFRCTDTPFDRAVRGDLSAISPLAFAGAELFYHHLGCGSCHSGPFQTDHQYHAIGVPQIGPGRGDNQPGAFDGLDDFGREQVTADPADRFKFRTPSLRQVSATGPWGHDGAYNDLTAVIRHHADPAQALADYQTVQAVLPPHPSLDPIDFQLHADPARRQALAATAAAASSSIGEQDVAALLEFLQTLSDPRCSHDLRRLIPNAVPSGLPVDD